MIVAVCHYCGKRNTRQQQWIAHVIKDKRVVFCSAEHKEAASKLPTRGGYKECASCRDPVEPEKELCDSCEQEAQCSPGGRQ